MSRRDQWIRIFKITIGVWLGLIITNLMGFDNKFTGALSALLVMTVSPSINKTKSFAFIRFASNVIGVSIGMITATFIKNNYIAVPLGVFLSYLIKELFKINISDMSTAIAALLVIDLSRDSPTGYSINRIVLIITGCSLGYIINSFLMPPNFGKTAKEKVYKVSKEILQSLNRIYSKDLTKEEYIVLNKNVLISEKALESLKEDATVSFRKSQKTYIDKIPIYKEQITLNRVALGLIETFIIFKEELFKLDTKVIDMILKELGKSILVHNHIVEGEEALQRPMTSYEEIMDQVHRSNKYSIIFLSKIIEYDCAIENYINSKKGM